MLYSEIIKEQKRMTITDILNPLPITSIVPEDNENQVIFEDIHKIYANGDTELSKINISNSKVFDDVFWKENNNIGFKPADATNLDIVYFVRPELKNG